MRALIFVLSFVIFAGCSEHRVDTFQEWCEQISGEDLEEKYAPFWSVMFSVSFDADSIREDYTKFLNNTYLNKIQNRVPKMVWRNDCDLHIINISSFFNDKPNEIISDWKYAIELANEQKLKDKAENCLYGTLISMFDNIVIHTITFDALGKKQNDVETILSTGREKRLGDKRL